MVFPLHFESNFGVNSFRESGVGLTLDFVSSFISEYFNFLQQKKVYEAFDYIFNQKLNLFASKAHKFGKKNFGLIHEKFSEEVGNSMERILFNSLFKKEGHCEAEHRLLKNFLEGSNLQVFLN